MKNIDTKPVLCQQRDVADSADQLPDLSYQMKKSLWREQMTFVFSK